jgi:hypothetical protein
MKLIAWIQSTVSLAILASPLAAVLAVTMICDAQQPGANRLQEPVYRVTKATSQPAKAGEPAHPLDPALDIARQGLDRIQSDVRDYTCTIAKRERVGDVLHDYEYMFAKIRNGKVQDGKVTTKFGVYLYFLKPEDVKGREVLYIEGDNNGKLMAKEGGLKGKLIPSVWLKPDSPLAMAGNLYPITDIGLENLVVKLIERAEREKKAGGECEVQFMKDAKINGRVCTLLQVKHPVQRPQFDFHLAQIFIDDEYQLPIRYAAYGWPEKEGGQPLLLEEYTYLNLKLNVGLGEGEFDHQNPNYKFH